MCGGVLLNQIFKRVKIVPDHDIELDQAFVGIAQHSVRGLILKEYGTATKEWFNVASVEFRKCELPAFK